MNREMQLLQSANSDLQWFSENYGKLLKEYDHRFVAVKNHRIIASSENFEELLARLKAKHIDPGITLTQFLTSSPRLL